MGGCITFCFASLVGLDWLCRQSLPTAPHPVGTLNFMVAVNHKNKAGTVLFKREQDFHQECVSRPPMALCIYTSCTFLPKPSFASGLKSNAPYLEPGSSSLGSCGGIGVEIMGGSI